MDSYYLAFDKHVTYAYLHVLPDLIFEDFILQVLVSGTYIFKTKWNDPVTKKILVSNKTSFFFVFGNHPKFVTIIESIHETKQIMV